MITSYVNNTAILNTAHWEENVVSFNFPQTATCQEKPAAALPVFTQSLQNTFAFHQISGNW